MVFGIKAVHPVLVCYRPGCVVPSAVVFGIKAVHPMFRGYNQQVFSLLQHSYLWHCTG